jgi:hydrogenase assembly chaperone HypC/HupF
MTLGPVDWSPQGRELAHEAIDWQRGLCLGSSHARGLSMCITLPARVLGFDGGDAIVEVDGRTRRASMLLAPTVEIDDWVLIAAGRVLRRLDAAEALELGRTIRAAIAMTEPIPQAASRGGPR